MDRWHLGQASLPFLRGGVSRSSLSDTRPLTANEKDPSAPLGMTLREEHFSSAHFIRYSGYPSPTLSFQAQREIFLALCSFLLLSQKVSPFPLSHIRHYPLLQERSLDFARDDDTGIALFKHIRCTLREINPFPHTVISSAARNLPRTPRFLASFAEAFPFSVSHIGRYTGVQERSRASLGMTLCEYRSLTLPIYFPCNNDTREAPSTFAALLCFYAPHYHIMLCIFLCSFLRLFLVRFIGNIPNRKNK